MLNEFSEPAGKRIYAGTDAEYDTNKYRNTLCSKWLIESDKTPADYRPFTPTSLLTTTSHAREKLEERHRRPTSVPNYKVQIERKHSKHTQRSPFNVYRDVIDAPDDFKYPSNHRLTHKKKNATIPFEQVAPPGHFWEDFGVHLNPMTPPPITGGDKKRRNGKRKHQSVP